jgi:hypothetical protein
MHPEMVLICLGSHMQDTVVLYISTSPIVLPALCIYYKFHKFNIIGQSLAIQGTRHVKSKKMLEVKHTASRLNLVGIRNMKPLRILKLLHLQLRQ